MCVCEREGGRERWAKSDFWSRPQNCNVEIVAIVNDAVGTLMSAAHVDRNCEIGLILGTGCNACYMEHLTNVETWDEEKNHPDQVRPCGRGEHDVAALRPSVRPSELIAHKTTAIQMLASSLAHR